MRPMLLPLTLPHLIRVNRMGILARSGEQQPAQLNNCSTEMQNCTEGRNLTSIHSNLRRVKRGGRTREKNSVTGSVMNQLMTIIRNDQLISKERSINHLQQINHKGMDDLIYFQSFIVLPLRRAAVELCTRFKKRRHTFLPSLIHF